MFGHTHFACDFRQDEVRILSAGTVTTARGDKGSIPLRSKPNVFIAALLSLSRTFDIRIDVNPGSTQRYGNIHFGDSIYHNSYL